MLRLEIKEEVQSMPALNLQDKLEHILNPEKYIPNGKLNGGLSGMDTQDAHSVGFFI